MCLSKAHPVTITLDRRGIRSGELSEGLMPVQPYVHPNWQGPARGKGNIILVKIRFRQKSKPKTSKKT